MVEQWTLDPLILVRIQVPQHTRRKALESFLKGFFLTQTMFDSCPRTLFLNCRRSYRFKLKLTYTAFESKF